MPESVEQSTATILQPRKPIAIIRLDNLENARQISHALLEGGITALEFTLTNQQAPGVIEQIRREFADRLLVGAGTVMDAEAARTCVQAGAQFLVTPAVLPDVIDVARSSSVPIACGAFTPTEIVTAWRAGADLVKVFPAGQLGPTYIKDVRGPLPNIPLVPTGGVNVGNCAAFLAAGAYTVAVGSQLVGKDLVSKKDWPALTELARRYVQACA